ncbi:FadR/GntR family transcriptional regulator [Promicromonospora panici]|uniref:FadR/GntR family transcriptional regulator n=1 Tax=Promicromonospora panici TaxID=2219658 RepID=UPI00101D62F7|nr:FadR/GntR family transcriptional regulator [Promicromonospora panici]
MSRTDEVVDGIRRMILDGRLRPGDRLPVEKDLADALQVSRGSLREGVRALSILGVVHTRQGDGTYVTSLDPGRLLSPMSLVLDLQDDGAMPAFHSVRRVLEVEAAGLAASRMPDAAVAEARAILDQVTQVLHANPVDHDKFIEIDIAFHRVIAAHTGNPVLEALIESFAGRTVRARLWRVLHTEGIEERTHDEHEAIWRALAAHDPEAARIRMASHLLGVEDSLPKPENLDEVP